MCVYVGVRWVGLCLEGCYIICMKLRNSRGMCMVDEVGPAARGRGPAVRARVCVFMGMCVCLCVCVLNAES